MKTLPVVIAARKIAGGSLSAFVVSDVMDFQDGFASTEPADAEVINLQDYDILCRDRHYHVCGEEYDAVISTRGLPEKGIPGGHYVARLAQSEGESILGRFLRWLRRTDN